MAKITDPGGNFPKRIDTLFIYRLQQQVVVRTQSGFTTEAITNNAKYARTLENAGEFGAVSSLCKAVRMALAFVLPKTNPLAVVNNFTRKMRQVMTYDLVSAPGKRNLAAALLNDSARNLLQEYDFNSDFDLNLEYTLGENTLLVKTDTIVFPKRVGRVGFRTHTLCFDFSNREYQLESTDWSSFAKTGLPNPAELPLAGNEKESGVKFTILETYFYTVSNQKNTPPETELKSVKIIRVTD